MFNISLGTFFCHILIIFFYCSCNKILLDICLTHVMLLFLFFLFRDLNLELSLPKFLFWFRKLCRFGCFHAHDKYIIV
jgi:hypothetical protein